MTSSQYHKHAKKTKKTINKHLVINTQLNGLATKDSYTQINENITYQLHTQINDIITVSLTYKENKQTLNK